jgi:exodeoxyribonuclease-3
MPKPLRIVSWNINSVRLRAPNVEAFVAAEKPDVLCLQETKCQDAEFPLKVFKDMGLGHVVLIEEVDTPDLCREGHARVIAARLKSGLEIHNIYLPAGGDVPDAAANEKFAHKLDFLDRLGPGYKKLKKGVPRILVGDLNVAPHENDVWSHKQLLGIVSHTPEETERLESARKSAGFADIGRLAVPEEQKLYTWWSYRAADWAAANKGRRLDHIWSNKEALGDTKVDSFRVHLAWRGGWKPSDHAPISVEVKA